MNAAIFAALKPGGYFIVVDSAARADSGTADVKTLHRIEESVVVKEVEAAGFKLVARSDVWRNPSDTKDWNSSPMAAGDRRGTSDRFALRFQRPR
jgi:predicted methyltransferase